MKQPKYSPEGEPDLVLTVSPLSYKPVPGIGFHKEDDGTIYYFDRPLMFVAYIEDQQVIVTLLDDDFNYPELPRIGWDQHIAIATDNKLLYDVCESRLPLREYWDQNTPNWFIQDEWVNKGNQVWEHVYKIWKNVPVLNQWKSTKGVYLNPKGKQG